MVAESSPMVALQTSVVHAGDPRAQEGCQRFKAIDCVSENPKGKRVPKPGLGWVWLGFRSPGSLVSVERLGRGTRGHRVTA